MSGRIGVMIVWLILIGFGTYGISKVETNFQKDFFIPKGSLTEDYNNLLKKYYDIGGFPSIFLYNEELDYASQEVQYNLLDFYEKLEKCYLCEEQWVIQKSIESPYL